MSVPGLPLAEHLPRGGAVLLVGGDDRQAGDLLRAGLTITRHAPDMGPLAQLAGIPFTPPVVEWPFPDVYRYVQETSRRGKRHPAVAGVGWRRHYPRPDLIGLLEPHFRVLHITPTGIGLEDVVRLAGNLSWRWLRRDETHDVAIEQAAARVARLESGWSMCGRGYGLMVLAER